MSGTLASSASGAGTPVTGSLGKISGRTFGGQQPINQAHVYVYSIGTGGYGQPSTSLLTAGNGTGVDSNGNYFVSSDATGAFLIASAVTCAAGTQAYLLALGGDPGFGTNTAAGLMAPLGACSSSIVSPPTSSVQINEVTTVGMAYALAGYARDSAHISSSGTALASTGVGNAMATALNIVSLSTGTVPSVTPAGNAIPPAAKIYTLANALASCINSAGPASSSCQELYTDTGTSTDTATAAIAIAHAPFSNVGDLYTLAATPAAPFAPALAVAPADWTMALQYQTPLYAQNLAATADTYADTYSAAVDAAGNLWTRATNSLSTSASANTVTTFVEYGPTGSAVHTTSFTTSASEADNKFVHLAVDSGGNVWSGVSGAELEINTSGTTVYTCQGMGLPSSAVFGSDGTVYAADFEGATIFQISPPSGSSSAFTCGGALTAAGATFQGYLAITNASHVIASAFGNGNDALYDFPPGVTGSTSYTAAGEFIAADNSSDTWTFSTIGGAALAQLFEYSPGGVDLSSGGFTGGGLSQPGATVTRAGTEGVHVDGAGAVWVGVSPCVNGTSGCTVQPDVVAGLGNDGTPITPSTGLALPGNASGAHALAVDGSGNLWVAAADGSLIQFVGLVTPVATPILPGNVGQQP